MSRIFHITLKLEMDDDVGEDHLLVKDRIQSLMDMSDDMTCTEVDIVEIHEFTQDEWPLPVE